MPFSIVPFVLLFIPLLEIAVFVLVGREIGVLATLALVVATAVAGSILLRVQGFGILHRMRRVLDEGGVPGRDLVHGVMVLVAGILLLVPGFVTDTLGFLLFIPAVRDAAWAFLKSRVVIVGGERPFGEDRRRRETRTIDLGSENYTRSGTGKSPWRRTDDQDE